MAKDATAHFQDLAQKLQSLLKQQEQWKRENEKLKLSIVQLQQQTHAYEQEIILLKEQLAIVQTAAGNMNEADKKAFEKRINQYLRDIDKVIAHLNTT
jgi:predicted  nucleic acid-binding Zn-ribbon protein